MNKAIILHGTSNNSGGNWIPWLKKQLKNKGWTVWTPDLPNADEPNMKTYLDYLSLHQPFKIDSDTVLIGHSSGAVAVLGLLQSLPTNTKVAKAILVSSFHTDLNWDKLKQLFNIPFDFAKIKNKTKEFIFIHSDNDPYVDISEAEYLVDKLSGQLRLIKGQGHFNLEVSSKYKEFPKLMAIILKENPPTLIHTAISVNDLEQSQKFYESVFDLKEVSKGARPDNGVVFVNLIDINGQGIEIFKHETPQSLPKDVDMMNFSPVGYKHVGFRVQNIEEVIEKALNNGARILWEIKPGITVKRIAFIADPDGLPIELVEI